MRELKTPTTEQIQQYRQACKTATIQSDLEKIEEFEKEYDVFTKEYEENGKRGIKDAAGEILVPAIFDDIAYTFTDRMRSIAVPVIKDGKMALVKPDGKGTLLTGFDYGHIVFDDYYYVLISGEKKGLATMGGNVIIPAEMDEIYTPCNDLAAFTKDGKFGFTMIGYNIITEPIYESYDIVTEWDYLQVVKDGVTGWIDESGNFTTDEDERFFNAACDL